MSKEYLSVLAGVIFLLAFFPYVRAILRRETKPSKASWVIWATLDIITLAGMWATHAVNGQIVGAVTGALVVVVLAIKYGEPGWTTLDKFCLGGAVVGILLWQTFDDPVLAILASSVTVFLGSFPTFQSARKNPENENRVAWTMYWISCVVAMFAIPQWTIQDAAQPITFLVVESTMMVLLYRPRTKRGWVRA